MPQLETSANKLVTEQFVQLLNRSIEPLLSCNNMAQWFEEHQHLTSTEESSLFRAALGGARFRQMSFAFASAYQSAIEKMFGNPLSSIGALCHNEKGVFKPREMKTFITLNSSGQPVVTGQKSFVSGGANAQILYVSAIDTRTDESKVVVLKLPTSMEGLNLTPLPALPFVPELSHASLALDKVEVGDEHIMQGDGYSDYIKPFRTEEDIHILASLVGQRCHLSVELAQAEFVERYLATLFALNALYESKHDDALSHLALTGIKEQCIKLFNEQDALLKSKGLLSDYVKAWERDKALLAIAEKAQQARSKKARAYFDLED